MATMTAILLAVVFLASGPNTTDDEPASALSQLEKAEQASSLAATGWQLWQSRNFEDAKEQFSAAVKLDPQLDNGWSGLGWSHFNLGEREDAIKSFERCLKLTPNHGAALNGLGQIFLLTGQLKEAEKHFLRAKNASAAWHGLVRLYLYQEKFDKAAKYLAKLEATGQYNAAELQQFAKTIEAKSLSAEMRRQLAPLQTTSAAEEPDALAIKRADMLQRGWNFFRQGKNRPAELAFRDVLKHDGNNQPATNGLAFSLLNQGKHTEAKPLFESMLENTPNHGGALNGVARCLKESGDTNGAIEAWKKLDEQAGGVTAATHGLAHIYMEQKKYKDALPYLKRLAQANSDDASTMQMLKLATQKTTATE